MPTEKLFVLKTKTVSLLQANTGGKEQQMTSCTENARHLIYAKSLGNCKTKSIVFKASFKEKLESINCRFGSHCINLQSNVFNLNSKTPFIFCLSGRLLC